MQLRVRIRRPGYQRNRKVTIGAVAVVAAVGLFFVPQSGPLVMFISTALLVIAGVTIWDGLRVVLTLNRHGMGIAEGLGAGTTWVAWAAINQVKLQPGTVSVWTDSRVMYQFHIPRRVRESLEQVIQIHLTRRERSRLPK